MQPCTLLAGETTCQTCGQPLSDFERQKITIRQEADTTTIARVTCPTAPKFWRWRDIPWPKVVQRDVEFLEHAEEVNEWKAELAAAILCGVFGLGAWFFRAHPLSVIGYVLAYLAGSWFTAQEVWERLQKRAIDVHFLMLAVALGSASIGAWGEGTTLLFLFSLSGALESFALGRTQREIRSLFREAPKFATVLDEQGHEREVQVEKLRPGMRLLVKPGAQFPVDAEIVKGQTASDESNLTGEVTPVAKAIGDTVLAGTINLWGAVEVLVLRPVAESSLQKIIHLIKDAQQRKAPAQQFTDRFGTLLHLQRAGAFARHVLRLVARLRPGAVRRAECRAQRLLSRHDAAGGGLPVRAGAVDPFRRAGGDCLERPPRHPLPRRRRCRETGRRQHRRPRQDRHAHHGRTARRNGRELSRRAARRKWRSLPSPSNAFRPTRWRAPSPATANSRACNRWSWPHFESITGQGLRARRNGDSCLLGRREWLAQGPHAAVIAQVPPTEPGFSEIWLAAGGLLGRLVLRDDIRPQARELVDELHREGLRAVVLTGDRKATAEHLRTELGIQDVRAELKPEEKLRGHSLADGAGPSAWRW